VPSYSSDKSLGALAVFNAPSLIVGFHILSILLICASYIFYMQFWIYNPGLTII
jgi:hypothetical protein